MTDAKVPGGERIDIIAQQVRNDLMDKMKNPEKWRPIRTGLDDLDKVIGGIVMPAYYAIGGPFKSGKTSLVQHLATCVAAYQHKEVKVNYYLLEELRSALAVREIVKHSNIVTRSDIRDLKLDDAAFEDMDTSIKMLDKVNLWVNDSEFTSEAIIRDAEASGANVGVVDYLQLLQDRGAGSQEMESTRLEKISRRFVESRNKTNMTWFVVYQTNDKGKAHGSRAVYRDADLAMEIKVGQDVIRGDDQDGILKLHILPGRICSGGATIDLGFSGAHSRVRNIPTLNLDTLTIS